MDDKCNECKYCQHSPMIPAWECRKKAPITIPGEVNRTFPIVAPLVDGCGEFEQKKMFPDDKEG